METNNNKQREALYEMVKAETDGEMTLDALCGRCIQKLHNTCKHDGSCWCERVIAALAEPPRNCEVGSVDEQAERFREFCDDEKGHREHCRNCRLCNAVDCELAWAQLPYDMNEEKGGANED